MLSSVCYFQEMVLGKHAGNSRCYVWGYKTIKWAYSDMFAKGEDSYFTLVG